MTALELIPEQDEAKRLLGTALAEGPAHAYLFAGPAGVGKRRTAFAFAGELLRDTGRVERQAHPDLYVLEPLGDQIRIDPIRELRRDLHMRPFEADRRVYLILSAQLLNEEAADALLKDLEEPPPYAVVVLVADELGPLPDTIKSRCQLVPFRRLSEAAIREEIGRRAPHLDGEQAAALTRLAAGRGEHIARLLDPKAAARRDAVLEVARAVYADPEFSPGDASERFLALAKERATEVREAAEQEAEHLALPQRELEQRLRRAYRGAERDELLHALELLESWYRDLVVCAAGAETAAVHVDRQFALREDARPESLAGAEAAAEIVRETWRLYEELQLQADLAFEALFIRLRAATALASVPA